MWLADRLEDKERSSAPKNIIHNLNSTDSFIKTLISDYCCCDGCLMFVVIINQNVPKQLLTGKTVYF